MVYYCLGAEGIFQKWNDKINVISWNWSIDSKVWMQWLGFHGNGMWVLWKGRQASGQPSFQEIMVTATHCPFTEGMVGCFSVLETDEVSLRLLRSLLAPARASQISGTPVKPYQNKSICWKFSIWQKGLQLSKEGNSIPRAMKREKEAHHYSDFNSTIFSLSPSVLLLPAVSHRKSYCDALALSTVILFLPSCSF